jgi:hypothetical protein
MNENLISDVLYLTSIQWYLQLFSSGTVNFVLVFSIIFASPPFLSEDSLFNWREGNLFSSV